MTKRILLGCFLIIIVSIIIISFNFNKNSTEKGSSASTKPDINIPIVAIHGTNGDLNSFNEVKNKLLNTDKVKGELGILVNNDNTLRVIGKLGKSTKHPFISIAFANNDAPPEEWRIGIEKALKKIKEVYRYDQVDVVGYSNGGLAILEYLEQVSKPKNAPKVRRLLTIGSPFNGIDGEQNSSGANFEDITSKSPELEAYLKFKGNIPSSLEVLAVGSAIKDDISDGIVPIQSALSARLIFKRQVKAYKEIILKNPKADHGSLPSLPETFDLIDQFFVQSHPLSEIKINSNS